MNATSIPPKNAKIRIYEYHEDVDIMKICMDMRQLVMTIVMIIIIGCFEVIIILDEIVIINLFINIII